MTTPNTDKHTTTLEHIRVTVINLQILAATAIIVTMIGWERTAVALGLDKAWSSTQRLGHDLAEIITGLISILVKAVA